MARLSICELSTYRWSLEEDVALYAATGIEAIGIWRQKLSDYGEERAVELLAEHRLAVSSLFWAGGFTGGEHSHNESIDDARDAIRLAAALHAGCLIVHSGSRGLHTQSHVRRLLCTALDDLLPLAEKLHVTLALEPMPASAGADWTFLTCLREAAELVKRYNSSALRLVFDTYYWGGQPEVVALLPDLTPHICLVQLADCRAHPTRDPNRCRLGEGRLPLRSIVAALLGAGYRGDFEAELVGEEFEACDYRELLLQTQQAFEALTAPPAKDEQPTPANSATSD